MHSHSHAHNVFMSSRQRSLVRCVILSPCYLMSSPPSHPIRLLPFERRGKRGGLRPSFALLKEPSGLPLALALALALSQCPAAMSCIGGSEIRPDPFLIAEQVLQSTLPSCPAWTAPYLAERVDTEANLSGAGGGSAAVYSRGTDRHRHTGSYRGRPSKRDHRRSIVRASTDP